MWLKKPIFLTVAVLLAGATAATGATAAPSSGATGATGATAAPSSLAVAHAARLPGLLVGYGTGFKVRPSTIYFTGDGSGLIGKIPSGYRAVGTRPGYLDWTVWTQRRAVATGTLWGKSCIPDCAASPFYRHALTLIATRVRHGHFTRMTLDYRDRGNPVSAVWCVPPRSRSWGTLFEDGRCE